MWTTLLVVLVALAVLGMLGWRLFRPGYGARRAPRRYDWEVR